MSSKQINSSTSSKEGFDLLSAIVMRDAAVEDIAAELRREGIDSVDEVLALVRNAAKERVEAERNAKRPVNLALMARETPPERIARIEQRVPKIPILINGTMYDPKDIVRFNGHELHFFPAATKTYMLAIEDRSIMARWWEFMYLSSIAQLPDHYKRGHHPGGSGSLVPATLGQPSPPGFYLEVTHGSGQYEGDPVTDFFEHPNSEGSMLSLDKNRGYWDLTHVHSGLFGWGADWNDRISSLQMRGTQVCVLHEDINMGGPTYTSYGSQSVLGTYAWDDRASSVETW